MNVNADAQVSNVSRIHAFPRPVSPGNLLQGLLRNAEFPHSVTDIQVIETHISWVVLTGAYVYKIKKPVDLGFVDFTSLAKRRYFCEEELRLNRRLAPELYLEVVPIGGSLTKPIFGERPAIECAVKMRQFDDTARLDHQLAAGALSVSDMHALAETIAGFHGSAPSAGANLPFGDLATIRAAVIENLHQLAFLLGNSENETSLKRLETWSVAQLDARAETMRARKRDAYVRECHGDLHLANLVRFGNEIIPFDCLEFDPKLRWVDVISEIAFLVMDLMLRDREDLAFAFLNRYLECTGDYQGLELMRFYLVYCCLVRCKVAAIQAAQRDDAENVSEFPGVGQYLNLAQSICEPVEKPRLIITHGLSGSGKTRLTDRLVTAFPAVRLRSDLERKRLRGLLPLGRSASSIATGLYDASSSEATYDHLASMAAVSLKAGFHTIVDASFLRLEQRLRFRALAKRLESPMIILDCDAPIETLQQRVSNRLDQESDASEATLEVLGHQRNVREPLTSDEKPYTIRVDTDQPTNLEALIRHIKRRIRQ